MGAGKTTLGRQFAEVSNFEFLDLDDRIIEQAGMSIPQIFEQEGEQGFRKREKVALHGLHTPNAKAYLVACGGGTPCFGDNMQWMNEHGLTIYLRPGLAEITNRLKKEQAQRPLIKDVHPDDLMVFIKKMLDRREHYYLQAQVVLEGDDASLEELNRVVQIRKGQK